MAYTSNQTEDTLLLARLEDAIYLSETHSCPRFIGFLDERQREIAQGFLKKREAPFCFFGGYGEALRTLCGVFPSFMVPENHFFDIAPLAFRYREGVALTHRDFLGTMLSCGVKREKIGDILCADELTVAYIQGDIAPFLCEQMTKVRGEGVRVSCGYEGALPVPQYKELRCSIASARLDVVVKALMGVSREEAAQHIEGGLVGVNHVVTSSISSHVKEGDCLSIRGKGRFWIDGMEPTRKERLSLTARKCV